MKAQKCVIASTDGMGKSTAAKETASTLSSAYPSHKIAVVDSTGTYKFVNGELTSHQWPWLESLEPHQTKSKVAIAARLGAFTLMRRAAEGIATRDADLVIGVRDPFRIDPATYARIFAPSRVQRLSPEDRLRTFSAMTLASHPDLILHLQSDSKAPIPTGANGQLDSHETPEKLQLIAEELPRVLSSYNNLYGTPLVEVEALRPTTSDDVTAQIERILEPDVTRFYFTSQPATQPIG